MTATPEGSALFDLVNGPIRPGTSHQRQMEALLRRFQSNGLTLADCTHPQRLGRSIKTLKRYARRLKLAFPDFTPLSMREPRPPKAPKAKRNRGG